MVNKVSADRKQKIEKSVDKLANSLKKCNIPKVGFKTKFIFRIMRLSVKKEDNKSTPLAKDYWYWYNNGWLGKKRPWSDLY